MDGVRFIPRRRAQVGAETIILPLQWASMFTSGEVQLSGATVPAIPTYDTAVNVYPLCTSQVGAGTSADVWWTIAVLPTTYLAAIDLTLSIDGIYVLGGDAVLVAATIDLEAFPYDSTNGDFSNADINATAAQALGVAFATEAFTLTGTNLTAGQPVLLRFTSSIEITSVGGAGTGQNGFNFPRLSYSGKI